MKLAQPTPELPVPDVEAAQVYYRDRMGFSIGWYDADGEIGAVSQGECAIFFRKVTGAIAPCTSWIFCEDIDAVYDTLTDLGATITDPLSDKPWGMRQFTVKDDNGHQFHFHRDL